MPISRRRQSPGREATGAASFVEPALPSPARGDPSGWIVTDDGPRRVPVTDAEVAVFEAWFGDVFDEIFLASPDKAKRGGRG
ncbi:hypothetical protein [Brevundimonas diminuta]|uniref:hypothetical protein n=1 Tax=Brevundimonas diminuta TaxID=293 RepID=UPI0030F525A2